MWKTKFFIGNRGKFHYFKMLRNNKTRLWWNIRRINEAECITVGFTYFMKKLRVDSGNFKMFCRLTATMFQRLCGLIEPKLRKQNFRKTISARNRLVKTLHFCRQLWTVKCYRLQQYNMSKCTCHRVHVWKYYLWATVIVVYE